MIRATRTAGSVLLTRGDAASLEVYLVERAPELRFFGGYWSLPGGSIDPVDRSGPGADEEEAFRRCAVRELFEETGVLAAALHGTLPRARRGELRRELLADRGAEDWGAVLPDSALEEARTVITLTTPPFSAIRFRTRFLHLELPAGEEPEVVPGELVRGRFVAPRVALEEWVAGELLIAPPVLSLLELIDEGGLEGMFAAAARVEAELEAGRLHPVRHTPGVFTAPLATPTIPPATTTNCYLVGDRRVWVIDPATYDEGERARLFALMDAWLAEGRRFEGVLLTHHHPDHVGSAAAVCRRYGLEARGHALTLERAPADVPRGAPLADGDELALGDAPDGRPGWTLRALFTPGHDRGHLCFLESRYGALIAGDLVSTLSTIVIDPPEGHMATYLASLRRVLDEPVGVIYPAHGLAWRDGKGLVRGYLAHRRQREERLARALAAGPRTEAELLPEVYADVGAELLPLAARSLSAGLEKLAEEGRAERDGPGWRATG